MQNQKSFMEINAKVSIVAVCCLLIWNLYLVNQRKWVGKFFLFSSLLFLEQSLYTVKNSNRFFIHSTINTPPYKRSVHINRQKSFFFHYSRDDGKNNVLIKPTSRIRLSDSRKFYSKMYIPGSFLSTTKCFYKTVPFFVDATIYYAYHTIHDVLVSQFVVFFFHGVVSVK